MAFTPDKHFWLDPLFHGHYVDSGTWQSNEVTGHGTTFESSVVLCCTVSVCYLKIFLCCKDADFCFPKQISKLSSLANFRLQKDKRIKDGFLF